MLFPGVLAPWLVWVILLVSAGVLFSLEWLVEMSVSGNPEVHALRLANFVSVVMVLLVWGTVLPVKAFGKKDGMNETGSTITEDDLKTLVDAGQEEGVFEKEERRMIYSIFSLGDKMAREVMVPRIDMVAMDSQTSVEDAIEVMLNSGHSRVPVYQGNVDQTLGVIYIKDLLQAVRAGENGGYLSDLLRTPYFVPEAKRLDTLLSEMQAQRIHIAIVVDEYGGVAGLVTLEDIVEEIVGEIQDEFDQGEELPYQSIGEREYVFLGRVDLDDFNEVMGSSLSKEEADTLGGYIYSQLGRVPGVGEKVLQENLLLTVEQVSARRIRKVRAQWLPQLMPGAEGNPEVLHNVKS